MPSQQNQPPSNHDRRRCVWSPPGCQIPIGTSWLQNPLVDGGWELEESSINRQVSIGVFIYRWKLSNLETSIYCEFSIAMFTTGCWWSWEPKDWHMAVTRNVVCTQIAMLINFETNLNGRSRNQPFLVLTSRYLYTCMLTVYSSF